MKPAHFPIFLLAFAMLGMWFGVGLGEASVVGYCAQEGHFKLERVLYKEAEIRCSRN